MSLLVTAASFGGASVPAIQLSTSQDVAYNASSGTATQSAAFSDHCWLISVAVHVATGSGVRIAMGANPDAKAQTSKLLPGSGDWFFVVAPNWKLSVISDDANTGTVNVTEAAMMG